MSEVRNICKRAHLKDENVCKDKFAKTLLKDSLMQKMEVTGHLGKLISKKQKTRVFCENKFAQHIILNTKIK